MILVIDAGNTNIVFGLFEGPKLVKSFRMATQNLHTTDEYGVFIRNVMGYSGMEPNIEGAIISSVVGKVTFPLKQSIMNYFGVIPVIVDSQLDIGLINHYDNPDEIGPDRIANAIAAYEQYKKATIVIDFGTATTFSVVNCRGEFLGGVILPGIHLSFDSLARNTSRLPSAEVRLPKRIIGKNTRENMQSGVLFGHVGQVKYLIAKIKEEMEEEEVKVIVTGGLSHLLINHLDIDLKMDHLTLEGLRIIYERVNRGA